MCQGFAHGALYGGGARACVTLHFFGRSINIVVRVDPHSSHDERRLHKTYNRGGVLVNMGGELCDGAKGVVCGRVGFKREWGTRGVVR